MPILSLGNSRASARHTSVPQSPGSDASEKTAVEPPSPKCASCHLHEVKSHQSASEKRPNPVKDLKQPLHGWPELAKLMADHPEFVSFPAFRYLNIKSLLYYQCQLSKLQEELHELEWEDHRDGGGFAGEYCENVDTLLAHKCDKDAQAHEQIDKLEEIRTVLKNYNAALVQFSQINALPQPDGFNIDCLREWIIDPKMGGAKIKGSGRCSWGDVENEQKTYKGLRWHLLRLIKSPFWAGIPEEVCPDLVTPHQPEKIDGLTRWVANDWVPFWEFICEWIAGRAPKRTQADIEAAKMKKSEEKTHQNNEPGPTLVTYSMNVMLRFTSLVATLVACLFPIVAITVLSKIHTNTKILGYIALFTALFALGLMSLTPPGTSITEIFTATAAFSAVLVVFVQNQNGNTNGS